MEMNAKEKTKHVLRCEKVMLRYLTAFTNEINLRKEPTEWLRRIKQPSCDARSAAGKPERK